jgi:predicted Zn-dependent protease
VLAGCVQNDGSRNPLRALTTVTEEQERETGASADAQLRGMLPLVDDPIVLGFLNDLGQDIVRQIEPQPFIYRFRLVADENLNAFALPGGYLYFHTATLLQAGSLDELAGVMAHEIAHVKARHYARGVEASVIPELLGQIAGIGLSVATKNPAPLVIGQSVNVALKLKWSRQFEAEADQLGAAFMARAGYDPAGMARFFQRIVAAERAAGSGRWEPPPYLFTHPDVEGRIQVALDRADTMTISGSRDPALDGEFRRAQYRLAMQLDRGGGPLRAEPPNRERAAPLLAEAERHARTGDREAAIATLAEAEAVEPTDPRLSFRRGELLHEVGRTREAIAAWRRALLLDPSVGLNYFRIGSAYKELGDRVNATFYLEQAERRLEDGGTLQKRVQREIERLTFPVIAEAGIADGQSASRAADTNFGHSREELAAGEPEVVWWAKIGGRFMGDRERIEVSWLDPQGELVKRERVELVRRPHVRSRLELKDYAARTGIWRVEARFEGDVVDRRTFRLAPRSARPPS